MLMSSSEKRREMLVASGLVFGSVIVTLALFVLSNILNLRGRATARQELWGTVTFGLVVAVLLVVPGIAAFRRRSRVPRWFTVLAGGLFALAALEVASVLVFLFFGVLLPFLVPDPLIAAITLAAGVVGLYVSGARAVEASRRSRPLRAIAAWACTSASAVVVVICVWTCLYFE